MPVLTRRSLLTLAAFLVSFAGTRLPADDAATTPPDAPAGPTFQRQPADAEAPPLQPTKGRTDADRQVLDALSHYMAGELYLERGNAEKGIKELERSAELNPASNDVYRLLVPAHLRQGNEEQARKYALQAAEQTSKGVQLLRAYVTILLQQNDIEEAIQVLQAGLKSKGVKRGSFDELALNRTLGHCQMRAGKKVDAAAAYRLLFEALQAGTPGLSDDEKTLLTTESGELYDEMGVAFLEAELPELALAAFSEGAKHRGAKSTVHAYNLALVFMQTNKPAEALQAIEGYLSAQQQEKGRKAYQLLADILKKLDKSDELLPRLEKLLTEDKHNPLLKLYLADTYVDQGRVEDAAKLLQEAGDPMRDPRLAVSLSRVLWRQGKYEEWLKVAGLCFGALQPRNSFHQKRLTEELQDLSQRFSEDMEAIAKNGEAVDGILNVANPLRKGDEPTLKLEQAWLVGQIAIDADRTDDVVGLYRYAIGMQNVPQFQFYQELGGHLIAAKRFKEAEEVFQEAADHPSYEPARSLFLSFVAIAAEMDDRVDDAIKVIEECRKLSPDEPQYALQHARIYSRAKQFDKAIALLEEIIRDSKGNPDFVRDCRFSLSAIHVQQGNFEKGEAILLQVIKDEPDHPQANNDLGYLWADRNINLDKAKPMIAKALKAEPENAAYLDSMGWVLYRLGEFKEAKEHLLKAAELLDGEDSTIFEHLADAHEALKEHDDAVVLWVKALKIESKKPFADQQLLERLKKKIPADQLPTETSEPKSPEAAKRESPVEGAK